MFNFAPQWRDPACAGDFGLALRRSVSVKLADAGCRDAGIKGLSPDRSPDRVEAGTGRGRGIEGIQGLRKKGGRFKAGGGRGPLISQV